MKLNSLAVTILSSFLIFSCGKEESSSKEVECKPANYLNDVFVCQEFNKTDSLETCKITSVCRTEDVIGRCTDPYLSFVNVFYKGHKDIANAQKTCTTSGGTWSSK